MLVTLYSLTYNLHQLFHVDVYKKKLWETIIFTNYEIIDDSRWFKVSFVLLDLYVVFRQPLFVFLPFFLIFFSKCGDFTMGLWN